MSKMIKCQFAPLVLRSCSFSTSKVIENMKKTKPQLLCKTKQNQLIYQNQMNSLIQNRNFGGSSPTFTNIDYDKLKEFINKNNALIIDVRSKEELAATGIIPHSQNIPLLEIGSAFDLTPDEFQERYHFPKPEKNLNIVFSCAKGMRSLKACRYVADLGYKNIFNYSEGWFGWDSHK